MDALLPAGTVLQGRYRIDSAVAGIQFRIRLETPDKYRSYGAALRTYAGKEIWRRDRIQPGQVHPNELILRLPAKLLANEDYVLTLSGEIEAVGSEEIVDYAFRVRR